MCPVQPIDEFVDLFIVTDINQKIPMNDLELMRGVGAGDSQSIRVLLDAHYEPIFRLLRHLSGSREDAEDLTQDVFLVARTKGGSFGGQSSIRTWLTRVAVNAHAKHRRRERLRRMCHMRSALSAPQTETLLDAEWLLGGLDKLTPPHRIAVLLHDVHGFSVGEVAQITGSPEGTVKARLHYARKHLQRLLICPDEETPK